MKISCTQENLNKGLQTVAHLAGRNLTLPILNNILIETEDNLISLSATNLEIGIRVGLRGKVIEPGRLTVPAKTISDYVGLLPKEKIDIVTDKDVLVLECLNYHTKIKGANAEDFPLIPILKQNNSLILDKEELKQAINQTIFSCSSDDMRPEINGVFFRALENELKLVATDSFRLVEKKIKTKNKIDNENKIIIPLKTLNELLRIIDGGDDNEVKIFLEENQIMFKTGDLLLISRLIDGQFPDYEPIIPTTGKTKIELNKEDIVKAVKLAGLFVKAGINDVNLSFSKDNQTTVSSMNAQVGENKTVLESKNEGEENEIVFNYRFFLEGINSCAGGKVELEMTSSANPALLKGKDDKSHLYLIMPIRQ